VTMPGGLPDPRPDQGFAPTGSPMAPGSSAVVRARQVIVFGPSGSIVGLFMYAAGTTPGPGNPPVVSITRASTDPFGNAVDPDVVAYGAAGSFVELTQGQIVFQGTSGQSGPATITAGNTAGFLDLQSGEVTGSDTPAEITLLSRQASGAGQEQIIFNALETIFNGSITATSSNIDIPSGSINLNMAQPANYPTAGKTLAQTQACLDALVTSMINRLLIN
jgi:hypothetical protein